MHKKGYISDQAHIQGERGSDRFILDKSWQAPADQNIILWLLLKFARLGCFVSF